MSSALDKEAHITVALGICLERLRITSYTDRKSRHQSVLEVIIPFFIRSTLVARYIQVMRMLAGSQV